MEGIFVKLTLGIRSVAVLVGMFLLGYLLVNLGAAPQTTPNCAVPASYGSPVFMSGPIIGYRDGPNNVHLIDTSKGCTLVQTITAK